MPAPHLSRRGLLKSSVTLAATALAGHVTDVPGGVTFQGHGNF